MTIAGRILPNPVASASTPYESPKRMGLGASAKAGAHAVSNAWTGASSVIGEP